MLYGIIRVIFFIILVIISVLLYRKVGSKRLFLLSISLTIIFMIVVWFVPFENVFVSFDSPQAVFEYAGHGEIINTVENTDSVALITKRQNNNFSTFFVIKNGDKYKIASFNSDFQLANKQYNSVNICLYNIKGTEDYYLRIWGVVTDELDLSDSCNTVFEPYYDQFSDMLIVNAIVTIPNINDYHCYINGDKIVFE